MTILFIIGIISITYFILVNLTFGYTTFSVFYLFIGLIMVGYSLFYKKLHAINVFDKFFKWFKIVLIIGMAIFLVTQACIVMYSKNSIVKSDYIVVLGAGVRGETITTTLRDRLNATLDYVEKINYDGDIIVSGGMGPGETITEAEAMRRYLVENGISNDKIFLEDKSTNTYENFKYSKDVIERISNKNVDESSIMFITTDFHALRSNMIAKRNGYEDVNSYTSKTKWYLVPSMYAREFFALGKSIVFDR